MSKWRIGVYLRLSSDDGEKEESNSISTQRSLINYFLSDKDDIKIYKYYVDDGYTGTDFNRPGFQEMEKDIYSGRINGLIVKDLSRLGRNYIDVGDFIDNTIPKYKLRFISVNDNVDSYLRPESMDSLEVAFKNLMNESYSKDTSNKIRSSHKTSKKNGKYIGVIAPFGYIKDEKDCHKFIVDSEAAKTVNTIFNLVIKGKSRQEIVEELNKLHFLTPSIYFKEVLKFKMGRVCSKWNVKMLDEILKDETYIGNLVQNKRQRISHKTHNIVRVAEEDWIIVKDHHKPIIKEDIFNQVQDILYNRNVRTNKDGKYYKYSGYIKCSDCNCNLHRITKPQNNIAFYYCGTYLNTKNCTKHYITEKEIDDTILISLNKYIEMMCDIKAQMDNIISYSSIEYNNEVKKIRLVEINKELEKYESLQKEVINDYQLDFISKDDFEDFNKNYLYELNKLRMDKEDLEKSKINNINLDWLNKFKKNEKLDSINKNIIDEFIKNIYINEDRSIKVIFKYMDQYEEAIKYLKSQETVI